MAPHEDHSRKNILRLTWWYWLTGLGALLWLLLRSGTDPRRLSYPCQRAAFPIATGWLCALIAFLGGSYFLRRYAKLTLGTLAFVGAAWLVISVAGTPRASTKAVSPPPVWEVPDPTSVIFVMDNLPPTAGSLDAGDETVPDKHLPDPAMDAMLAMLETQDIYLHRTIAQPDGVVGASDVVIIKGNFQWTFRNTTSTDRIKGLIWQILQHPDGFNGEIIICDNTQDIGTGINHYDNNSEDVMQTIIDVIDTFQAKGYPIYGLNWAGIWDVVVSEYDQGDYSDGYVFDVDTKISYPKFNSPSGQEFISLRHGVWNVQESEYEPSRLCIIDFPVLKAHGMAGATVAVKNWIGVLTTAHSTERYGSWNSMHYDYFWSPYALVARVMTETFPSLVFVDAAWTCAHDANSLAMLVNTDMLLASTDPVAVSWYAAKYILTPLAWRPHESNPDLSGSRYDVALTNWLTYFRKQGISCTRDSTEISVYNQDILVGTSPVPAVFTVQRQGGQAAVHIEISGRYVGVYARLWRQEAGSERQPISDLIALDRPLFEYLDPLPPSGEADYWLQLIGQDDSGGEAWFGPVRLTTAPPPRATALQNVYPNPFNPQTTVAFSVQRTQRVRVSIFDLTGREVADLADRLYEPGTYTVDWDGRDVTGQAVASGPYLVRLNSAEREESRKIMLVR